MRKFTAIIMSLILLVSLSVSASAAAAREFLLQEYDVTSDEVLCYGKKLPAGGKLEVSVDSRILENTIITTLEQKQIPVTVYCLVDSSTSLSDKMVRQRNDFLLTLSSLMNKEDSMVLATIDDTLTESKPMNTKDVRDTAINTIAGQSWYTNLYDGTSQALKTLHTNTAYNTNRCLVILSDGHDDGKSTTKGDTILKQIQEIGIPVYSVILGGNSIAEKDLTLQKQFADESLGGFQSFPDRDSISGSASAQLIWDSIKGASAIRINLEELQPAETDQQLLIRYDAADTRYEDTILVRAVDLPVPVTEPIVETTEETTAPTETTDESDNDKTEGMSAKLMLICGIGVVLLGIGIAAFFLLRKKPVENADNISDTWSSDEQSQSAEDFSFTPTSDVLDFSDSGAQISSVTEPVANRCQIHAVALMHPEISVDFYLTPNMESTFGRTNKAEILLNPNDSKLSGCHGCFFWDGKMLLVQDRQSTNGTAVNGEICPKNVWLRLENGAVLTAGNYEYRITFQN